MSILGENLNQVNQILPHKNKWAWDLYLKGCANNWMPTEISMQKDIEQWKSNVLTDDERLLIKRCLGFFACSESLIGNNLLLTVFKYCNDGEIRQYIARQQFEECYIDGTEVLTTTGWKKFQDLLESDKIAQYTKSGNIEYVNYTNLVNYDIDDELIEFKDGDGKIDLLVTKNHRMIGLDESGNLVSGLADKISYSHKRFIVAGNKIGKNKNLSDWERFLIAFQADGSFQCGKYRNGNHCGHITVSFNFKKQRKIDRIKYLCSELGFKIHESEPNEHNRFTYYIQVPIQYKLSKQFDWINLEEVDKNWCVEFIEELKNWDGWQYSDSECGYDSTIEYNIDIAQIIGVFANYKVHRAIHIDNRKKTYNDLHRLSFHLKKNWVSRDTISKSKVPYTGKVYCCSVPSSMLLVRYNKKVMVSGNSLHALTVVYCCDSLNLNVDEIYEAYLNIPTVKNKDDFLIKQTEFLYKSSIDVNEILFRQSFAKMLFIYYVLFEGLLFYNSFAALLSLKRRNLMPGLGQQIEYTLRDEQLHVSFGTQLINKLNDEQQVLHETEANELLNNVVELESSFINEMIPNDLLGFNKNNCFQYLRYLANKRFKDLHLNQPYPDVRNNPLPWLSENIDLSKMKNFFESRVIDYKVGSLVDDF